MSQTITANALRNAYKMFVGNLPWTIGNRELQLYFSKYGHVSSASVVFDKYNGMSKGYGFLVFSSRDGYDAALNKTDHKLDGRVLTIQEANT